MSEDLRQALQITDAAVKVAMRHFEGRVAIELKGDESPVTVADRETEAVIRAALAEHFPEDGIYGEEYGTVGLERNRIWVIDPIDGTRSFIAGVPLFGMLMALMQNGVAEIGIVRLPALGQVYAAMRGHGAALNSKQIHCSAVTDLGHAMVFINEGEKIWEAHPQVFKRLMGAGRLRRLSYDCQPHALLAEAKVDAVVDYQLQPYDYLPLVPVIEEAGGVISDWDGGRLGFERDVPVVAAATPELHREVLQLLRRG